MALNIKSEEAHRLASEISKATGQNMTEVVVGALRQRKIELERDTRAIRAREILADMHARLNGEPLPDVNDFLYDPITGLPS
ncbi:MAG: type II toxin-antitoxin system VapB family antitoxin [Fimbriimonas sp.]